MALDFSVPFPSHTRASPVCVIADAVTQTGDARVCDEQDETFFFCFLFALKWRSIFRFSSVTFFGSVPVALDFSVHFPFALK